ncbi:ketoacyl-ACP synthase III family protein [Streptomyces sulphureus]|uniref:ketoacyl-ACP synthase III family protein n=1 Tax=Streptomyces sulphureus TaxID=47758 RepID=UPI000376F6C6|nr:ketoacyl-ACP synthase III family protein [Streptomyces sulphureus]
MRFDESVTLEAAACWLPPERERAADLVAAGRLPPEGPAEAGVTEVPVASARAAPEMAVLAGRRALSRADVPPDDIGLLLHSWLYHQGHDFWSPAHFVAHGVGAPHALPVGVQQMCHGGAVSLYTAAAQMSADPALRAALVTTGDRFQGPGFDRWGSDSHAAYGDGATAAVLGRSGRGLSLLAHTVHVDSALESMYRGSDSFSAAPLEHSRPVDVRRTKKAFAAAGGLEEFARIAPAAIRGVIDRALEEAGLAPADPRVRQVLLPRLGPRTLELTYLPALRDRLPHAATVRAGADTGHLGSGDAVANLAHLQEHDLLDAGEFALVLTGGGGFTWSCLVVRRSAEPADEGSGVGC